MKKTCHSTDQTYDLRSGYTRYLGVAHIIGEVLQRFITKDTLQASYAITTAYILADTIQQSNKAYEQDGFDRKVAVKAGDVLIWHTCASILLPGYIVKKIQFGTNYWLLNVGASCLFRKYLPVAIGLMSIPIIIKPIDRLVNHLMNETYRKYIK